MKYRILEHADRLLSITTAVFTFMGMFFVCYFVGGLITDKEMSTKVIVAIAIGSMILTRYLLDGMLEIKSELLRMDAEKWYQEEEMKKEIEENCRRIEKQLSEEGEEE